MAYGGVLVDFYAPKGTQPSATTLYAVEAAARAVGATPISAVTVNVAAAGRHGSRQGAGLPPGGVVAALGREGSDGVGPA
jgi:hypothetical protein